MTLPYTLHTDHAFPGGAPKPDATLAKAARTVADEVNAKARPYQALPFERADLAAVRDLAKRLREGFRHLVVVGTGGSSLGGRCLAALLPLDVHPALHFLENADPHTIDGLLAHLSLGETAFVFISKSGGTLETLSQALLITAAIEEKLGSERVKQACFVITEPKDSPLRRLAQHYGMQTQDHDPGLGGRFSVLSNVGLLPACVCGLDIEAVRHGAQEVAAALVADPSAHPAVGGAFWQLSHMQAGKNIHVLMPYADRLRLLGDWFRQLTAESLGKDGHGFTPLSALGTVDHHSMLQLFLDGPDDKFYSFVTIEEQTAERAIDGALAEAIGMGHVAGKDMVQVSTAAARGTIETIEKRGWPIREFALKTLDERSLGALLMHFELETAVTAQLLGIDAYDQPAVEESKQRTMKYLTA